MKESLRASRYSVLFLFGQNNRRMSILLNIATKTVCRRARGLRCDKVERFPERSVHGHLLLRSIPKGLGSQRIADPTVRIMVDLINRSPCIRDLVKMVFPHTALLFQLKRALIRFNDGVHSGGAEATLLERVNPCDRRSAGTANGVLQSPGMLTALKHQPS